VCAYHCLIYCTVDGSRCRISAIPGQEGSDYINASYVDVSVCGRLARVHTLKNPFHPISELSLVSTFQDPSQTTAIKQSLNSQINSKITD